MPTSREPHARKSLRLLTLGGASLVDSAGLVVAEQRRRLALLVLIAAGRGKGVSRDRLMSYLSPESTSESARHSLHQLIYYVRQQAGDDVLLGTDPMRLNPAVITSDGDAFDEAMDRGDYESAVALYRGPFLDGFHLADSSEFESWSAAERERLASRCADAITRLATAADERADLDVAIDWWSRLAVLDPLSGRAAMGLVRALVAAGDVPTALRRAAIHEAMVREELGTPVAPALAAYVAEIGASRRSATDVPVMRAVVASSPSAPSSSAPVAPPATRKFAPRRVALVGALAIALVFVVFGAVRTEAPPALGLTIVLPFRLIGSDLSIAWLHEGLVDLLSDRLNDASGHRTVEARTAIAAWRRSVAPTDDAQSQSAVIATARRMGAANAVTGTALYAGSEIVLRAELLDVATARTAARVEARGKPENILQLVDTIAVRLVSIQGGEDMLRDGVLRAQSVPAVRAYLRGRQALRRHEWDSAAVAFDTALSYDSTFASAALGLRTASGRSDGAHYPAAQSIAWRHRDRLTPRERAIFLAELGPNYPAWYPHADRLAAWRALTANDLTNADAWFHLGMTYRHQGTRLGVANPLAEARFALERALDLDPAGGDLARLELSGIASITGDSALLERVLGAGADTPATPADSIWQRWLRAFTRRDSAALRATRPQLARLKQLALGTVWANTQRAGYDMVDGELAESIFAARAASAAERAQVASWQYLGALNRGRPLAARRAAAGFAPEWRPLSRQAYLVLGMMYGRGDSVTGTLAAHALRSEVTRPLATDAAELRSQKIHVCVAVQWAIANGDAALLVSAPAKLRAPEPDIASSTLSSFESCALIAEAGRAVLERRPNARRLVEKLDSIQLSGTAWHWPLSEHRVTAKLWELLGEPQRALAATRRRLDVVAFIAGDLRAEGALALRAADTTGALAAWRHYLVLHAAPEAGVKADVDWVRKQVAAMEAAR